MSSETHLPPVSSPSVALAKATPAESVRILHHNYPTWGSSFTNVEDYIAREAHALKGPLARDGGLTGWILTDTSLPPDERPILSSCETYKKQALVAQKDGSVRESTAYGIASVFTPPDCRGKGYAGKMMTFVADELRSRQQQKEGDADFSVLWSDIGPKYYHKFGWKPYESTFLEFPSSDSKDTVQGVEPITRDNLPSLVARDEELIRGRLAALSKISHKTHVAVLPDQENLLWHLDRQDYMCNQLFGTTSPVLGAVYTPKDVPRARVWAIWACSFYGGLEKPEKNTMEFLRFVIEGDIISDETLKEAVELIVKKAQEEGRAWRNPKMEIWNPGKRLKQAVEAIPSLKSKFIVRESEHIQSLQWFGEGSADDIEWIVREKYAWC